jgi:hypothetical protein
VGDRVAVGGAVGWRVIAVSVASAAVMVAKMAVAVAACPPTLLVAPAVALASAAVIVAAAAVAVPRTFGVGWLVVRAAGSPLPGPGMGVADGNRVAVASAAPGACTVGVV